MHRTHHCFVVAWWDRLFSDDDDWSRCCLSSVHLVNQNDTPKIRATRDMIAIWLYWGRIFLKLLRICKLEIFYNEKSTERTSEIVSPLPQYWKDKCWKRVSISRRNVSRERNMPNLSCKPRTFEKCIVHVDMINVRVSTVLIYYILITHSFSVYSIIKHV